jgi:hypothetical protein
VCVCAASTSRGLLRFVDVEGHHQPPPTHAWTQHPAIMCLPTGWLVGLDWLGWLVWMCASSRKPSRVAKHHRWRWGSDGRAGARINPQKCIQLRKGNRGVLFLCSVFLCGSVDDGDLVLMMRAGPLHAWDRCGLCTPRTSAQCM